MNPKNTPFFLFALLLVFNFLAAQNAEVSLDGIKVSKLFRSDTVLNIRLEYSNKTVKSETNDSTYMDSKLQYLTEDEEWKKLNVKIRSRGNFRLANCYYAPIKMKIKKEERKGTVFKGNKKLKLVLPCMLEKGSNDNVVKEYLAYKIYEHISPFHFKTRMFQAEYTEQRGKKTKEHMIKGFFIEDLDKIVERFECNELQRSVHPLQQDGLCSTRNAFFQFMIGNTDFSTGHQHNEKLIFVNKQTVPVPYDFDMSGLVNASYSRVSQIGDTKLPITKVRDRLYRGFKRDPMVFKTVRQEFLDKKETIMETVEGTKPLFDNVKVFESAKAYLLEYFAILGNEAKFNNEIVSAARTK